MILLSGGIQQVVGQDKLEEYNITEQDLKISPNLPDVSTNVIDLEQDIFDRNTIIVENTSTLTEPDWGTPKVVVPDGSSGSVTYQLDSSTEILNTKVRKLGFFDSPNVYLEEYDTQDTSGSPIDRTGLKGSQSWDLADNTDFVRFDLTNTDAQLYEVEQQNNPQRNFFQNLTAWLASGGNAMASWLTLLSGLPSVLRWLSYALVIIGLFVVLELILW